MCSHEQAGSPYHFTSRRWSYGVICSGYPENRVSGAKPSGGGELGATGTMVQLGAGRQLVA